MFDQSLKELLEIVETHYGTRAARWVRHLGVAAVVCLALTSIGTFMVLVNRYAVTPALRFIGPALGFIPKFNLTGYYFPLLSVGITILLFVVAGLYLSRFFRRWATATFAGLDSVLTDASNSMTQNIEELTGRVAALEDEKKREALMEALVQREIRARLTIHSARYGAKDTWVNVTLLVRLHVMDGKTVNFPVENAALGNVDPIVGEAKEIEVVYSVGDGPKQTATVKEHARLRLPEPIPGSVGDFLSR